MKVDKTSIFYRELDSKSQPLILEKIRKPSNAVITRE